MITHFLLLSLSTSVSINNIQISLLNVKVGTIALSRGLVFTFTFSLLFLITCSDLPALVRLFQHITLGFCQTPSLYCSLHRLSTFVLSNTVEIACRCSCSSRSLNYTASRAMMSYYTLPTLPIPSPRPMTLLCYFS